MRQTLTGYDILLIEDNEADAHFFSLLLKRVHSKLGPLHLKTASTIQAGLEAIKATDPDVILLDLSLPDATGIEGVIAVKRLHPAIPVIVLTGLQDSQLAGEALKAGAFNYLTKESVVRANEMLKFWVEATIQISQSSETIRQLQAMQAGRLDLITACSSCNRWLDKAAGVWLQPKDWIEQYGLYLSHTVCVECGMQLYGDILAQMYD